MLWPVLDWVARIGFVTFFVMSGINHLINHKEMTAYAQSKNLPAPGLAVAGTGIMMLAAAAMILFQWHADWGAGLLILFLVPTAFTMHNFWTHADAAARKNDLAHFFKNLTIAAGALLYIVMLRRAGM